MEIYYCDRCGKRFSSDSSPGMESLVDQSADLYVCQSCFPEFRKQSPNAVRRSRVRGGPRGSRIVSASKVRGADSRVRHVRDAPSSPAPSRAGLFISLILGTALLVGVAVWIVTRAT